MPSLRRLKRRPEFLAVAATRRNCVTPGMIVQFRRRRGAEWVAGHGSQAAAETCRFVGVGFTVSRKVGSAVVRNRVRRRLRAVAAEILPEHGKCGCDYVLIGRRGTLKRPFAHLVGDLRTALARVHRDARGPSGPK